jgi:hypothetical protein
MQLGEEAQATPRANTVSVRRDSTNIGSHPPKQGAEELVVKPGVWVDGEFRVRLAR